MRRRYCRALLTVLVLTVAPTVRSRPEEVPRQAETAPPAEAHGGSGSSGRYRVRIEPAGIPALSSTSDSVIWAWQVTPAPSGGFLVVERGWTHVYRVAADGVVDLLVSPDRVKEGFEKPLQMAADERHVLTYSSRGLVLQVSDPDLEPVAQFTAFAFNAAGSVELAGDTLFGMGRGVVLAEEPIRDDQLLDDKWLREHWRLDCRIFRIFWREKTRQPDRVVCDPELVNQNSETMSLGDLLHHNGKVFAAIASTPSLYILEIGDDEPGAAGGQDRLSSDWFRKVSLLEPDEEFGTLTRNQIEAEKAGRTGNMAGYWENRERFTWFQGLVRAGAGVGVIFRIWTGEESRFVVDVYDADGAKLANDVPIPLPRRGHRAIVAYPVNQPSGEDYILVKESNDQLEYISQELYRVMIEESQESPSESVEQ